MSFTFLDNKSGEEEIWRCTECSWLSTKRHFHDGPRCHFCNSEAEQIGTQTNSNEMPAYQYQQILTYLEDEVSGVGAGTVSSIKDSFENGNDFIDACKNVYKNRVYAELTDVSGIGKSTAKSIALGMAEKRNWENGSIIQL